MTASQERLPPILAAAKNAEAVNMITAGKLREALRALNEAIYSSPDYPHSYANRAVVFDRLGMAPQAEGDRRRARELAESGGYSFDEVFAPASAPARKGARPPAPPRRKEARDSYSRQGRRFMAMSETAVVLVALGGLAATAGGLYLAADTLRGADINLNVFEFDAFQESQPNETTNATPQPTPEPTPPPVTPPPEVLAGTPYSFSTLQEKWKAKGIETSIGSVNNAFTGFKVTPFDITLSRGAAKALFSVLIYADRSGPAQDWDLGGVPSPQGGRRAPGYERGWYNSNVILLLRSGSGEIANDAKSAFLELG